MYDYPHTSAANDLFWTSIRDHLGYGPNHLTRDRDVWDGWQSPNLVFSQTCGLPFRACLHRNVQLVGTPDYGLKDCPRGYYNSVIVVRNDTDIHNITSLSGLRLAYNDGLSQSGWAAPLSHMTKANIPFETGVCTGGHKASAQAIVAGQADFAAIDALTWEMLRVDDPKTIHQLRVIGRTEPTPALPFITSPDSDQKTIQLAVSKGIENLTPITQDLLHLKGLVQLPQCAYLGIPIPPSP